MIPKVIHYCWFGRGKKSKLAQKCIASWRKYAADYTINEWNEDNFEIEKYPYAKFCYENKKWAFLSDFARLIIIYNNGGIYFDTDVELIKPIDALLQYDAFYGFEDEKNINTGEGFGAIPYHPTVQSLLDVYLDIKSEQDGTFPCTPCPKMNTMGLLKYGLKLNGQKQILDGVLVLPSDFMNPYDDPMGRLRKTKNTISIHWYSKSWISKRMILRSKLMKPIHRVFGVDCFKWLKDKIS